LPDVDCVIAPYGSGGLVTGIACGMKALGYTNKKCKIYSAEPETGASFSFSKKLGKPSYFDKFENSFVDGSGGSSVLKEIWDLASKNIYKGLSIPLKDTAEAIKVLAERNKIVAEGAGALSVAAAMKGMCGKAKRIVCIISGGGIDTDKLIHILQGKGVPPMCHSKKKSKKRKKRIKSKNIIIT